MPNVFLALAHRPDEMRAFFAYHDALMDREGGLSKAEKEMIVVATSNDNGCQYCVIAHGAILRIRAKNPLIADQVAINYRKADLTPRQMAMLDFAMKVSKDSRSVSDQDFETLRGHGFDDEDIWDIAAITGRTYLNVQAHAYGIKDRRHARAVEARIASVKPQAVMTLRPFPKNEFYSMGRKLG